MDHPEYREIVDDIEKYTKILADSKADVSGFLLKDLDLLFWLVGSSVMCMWLRFKKNRYEMKHKLNFQPCVFCAEFFHQNCLLKVRNYEHYKEGACMKCLAQYERDNPPRLHGYDEEFNIEFLPRCKKCKHGLIRIDGCPEVKCVCGQRNTVPDVWEDKSIYRYKGVDVVCCVKVVLAVMFVVAFDFRMHMREAQREVTSFMDYGMGRAEPEKNHACSNYKSFAHMYNVTDNSEPLVCNYNTLSTYREYTECCEIAHGPVVIQSLRDGQVMTMDFNSHFYITPLTSGRVAIQSTSVVRKYVSAPKHLSNLSHSYEIGETEQFRPVKTANGWMLIPIYYGQLSPNPFAFHHFKIHTY